MVWFFVGLAALAIYFGTKGKSKHRPPAKKFTFVDLSTPKPPITHIPFPEHGSDHAATINDDCDTVEIVGESHYQNALIEIFGTYTESGRSESCQAELVREPKNKFDKNAVRCEIQGKLVGYVNKDEAEDVAAHMKKKRITKMTVTANISGGWDRGGKNNGMYGVEVELHPSVMDPD